MLRGFGDAFEHAHMKDEQKSWDEAQPVNIVCK
jgi:hypothetical protein